MKQALQRWIPSAQRCIKICEKLYPVKGLIVSPDIERAFLQLCEEFPALQLHRYPTGSHAEDWVVPEAWEAKAAELKSASGELIASLDEHFLFVAPYSEPIDGWFTKAEIVAHCRTNRAVPDAFCLEHRNAYNYQLIDWGITLPYNQLDRLRDDEKYHLTIKSERKAGDLIVGEWLLPGKRSDIVCICSQFDELCNDGQSSAVVGTLLMEALSALPEREFTYQLLLVPEMFGSLFHVYHHQESVNRTVAMLNLETLGAGDGWNLKKAFKGGGALEESIRVAFNELGIPFKEIGFFDGFGNDERVFGWPTIGVPGPGIQRHPFREYHTAMDTPALLESNLLAEAMAVAYHAISTFEKNYIPEYTRFLQPWLTKHELYTELWNDFANHSALNNELLYHIDGKTSALELARLTSVPFKKAYNFLQLALNKGVIRKRTCDIDSLRY